MRGKRLKSQVVLFKTSATTSVICFIELSRRELKIENRLHLSEMLYLQYLCKFNSKVALQNKCV